MFSWGARGGTAAEQSAYLCFCVFPKAHCISSVLPFPVATRCAGLATGVPMFGLKSSCPIHQNKNPGTFRFRGFVLVREAGLEPARPE